MPLLAEERLPKKGNPIGIFVEPLKLSECGLGEALRQCVSSKTWKSSGRADEQKI